MSTLNTTDNTTVTDTNDQPATIAVAAPIVEQLDAAQAAEKYKLDTQTDTLTAPVAAPKKPRKQRAPKHDFKDGLGRVFAHRHANGNGWVADTATVSDNCYVGSRAQVGQWAQITGGVRIEAKAHISGYAQLTDQTRVTGQATVAGRAYVSDSVIMGISKVFGDVRLIGSRVENACRIAGNGVVRGSQLSGRVMIAGSPLVVSVTARGIIDIVSNATVIRSGLYGLVAVLQNATVLDSHVHNFFYHTTNQPDHVYDQIVVNRRCVVTLDEFASVQNGTDISTPLHVRGRSMLFNCKFQINEPGYAENFSHVLRADGSDPEQSLSELGRNWQRPDIVNKTWNGANLRTRDEFDRLARAPENGGEAGAMRRVTRDDYTSPYSLERLTQGRRVMPV